MKNKQFCNSIGCCCLSLCFTSCFDNDGTFFFPRLLDKLYENLRAATWTLHPEDDDYMRGEAEIYEARTLQLVRTRSGKEGRGLDTTGDGLIDTHEFVREDGNPNPNPNPNPN